MRRALRRLFTRFRVEPARDPETSMQLAAHLSGVAGTSFVWCGCGQLLTPIVYGHEAQAEVVALTCVECRRVRVPVCVGVLMGSEAD